MINFNNHNIKYMSYNGHMIKSAYGCDARLVWEEDSHHDYSGNYFTIVCKSGRVSIRFTPQQYVAEKRIYVQWGNRWLPRTSADTINLVAGETAVFKGNLRHQGQLGTGGGIGNFTINGLIGTNGTVTLEGNIMSLVQSDNFTGDTSIGEMGIFKGMFQGCTTITSAKNLVLPSTSLTFSCYEGMFAGCTNLTTAPDLNAEKLAALCYYGMFSGCTNLNYIKCLATGDLSGNYTDLWVSGVQTVGGTFVKKAGVEWPDWTEGTGSDGIPKNWTVIEEGFDGKWLATYANSRVFSAECDSTSAITQNEITKANLVSVEIGDCVRTIDVGAFYQYGTLKEAIIGNNVTNINKSAFMYCSGLTSVNIPSGVTNIGETAFAECKVLTGLTIPNAVTSIGNSAFTFCYSITNITIPNGVTEIKEYTFKNCESLTSVTIPNSVTSIGEYAFHDCISLTNITIPSGVTRIDYFAFAHCSGLTSITCLATTPPTLTSSSTFSNTNNCPIFVPAQSVDAYKSATNWSTYASRIQPIQ